MMKPEQYFFRYAWPCTEVLLQKKKITGQRFDDLKFEINNGITPSRQVLEDTYKTAFENIKKIAEGMKKEHWDISAIKKYFEGGGHNNFIDSGGGEFGHAPESLKEMCRVHEAEITGVKKGFFIAVYTGKGGAEERVCQNIYNLNLRLGDKVRIHYGYVVEKV